MSLSNSMMAKLAALTDRYAEVSALLSDPDVMKDRDQFTTLSKEFAELDPVIKSFQRLEQLDSEMHDAQVLAKDDDVEMRELASEDIDRINAEQITAEQELQTLLLPKDPNDASNVFLEIRAGTGGDEAALFARDLYEMYKRHAEVKRWKMEILDTSPTELGGFKEITLAFKGLQSDCTDQLGW